MHRAISKQVSILVKEEDWGFKDEGGQDKAILGTRYVKASPTISS